MSASYPISKFTFRSGIIARALGPHLLRAPKGIRDNQPGRENLSAQIDCQTLLGRRDDALLQLLYNTGMRAQDLVDLEANHLRFSRPYPVRIYGKGRKERTCPLWNETLNAVRMYMERRSVRLTDAVPLFVNVE